ncbi:MAG: hypothetical protein U5J98_07120 [Halobacteriales archaeon]|nr:hypothetical protein [Halobacteriales archaeon]
MPGYEVAIKPSARRLNRAAGEWVGRRGRSRTFAEKSDAQAWAQDISSAGRVRVQDVAPNDPADVDGYLVADPNRERSASEPAGTTSLDVD